MSTCLRPASRRRWPRPPAVPAPAVTRPLAPIAPGISARARKCGKTRPIRAVLPAYNSNAATITSSWPPEHVEQLVLRGLGQATARRIPDERPVMAIKQRPCRARLGGLFCADIVAKVGAPIKTRLRASAEPAHLRLDADGRARLAEPERSVQLTLQPWSLGGEIRIID